jgi:hypothetical protein
MKPFEIIVYAIVALALLGVVFNLFPQPQESFHNKIEKRLLEAQGTLSEGKLIDLGTHTPNGNELVTSESLTTDKQTIGFQCNSTELCCSEKENCSGKIIWDTKKISLTAGKQFHGYLRCEFVKTNYSCFVYVGKAPAQTKVDLVTSTQTQDKTIKIETTLSNTGNDYIYNGKVLLSIQQINENNSQNATNTPNTNNSINLNNLIEEEKEISSLAPNGKTKLIFTKTELNDGKYTAEIKFSGEYAGVTTNTTTFEIKNGVNCKVTNNGEGPFSTTQVSNGYWEWRTCENCAEAYQCLSAWQEKEPNTTFNFYDEQKVYCEKQTVNGICN